MLTADVLIMGSGPAGAALALALKRAGIPDVVITDSAAERPEQIGEAASPGLTSLLRRLELDDRLEVQGHHPCHGNRSFWGSDEPSITDFIVRAQGPGWHLDRAVFDKWLLREATSAGADLLLPARLEDAHWEKDRWQVRLRRRDETFAWETRWIVDATGRPAAFARRHGARLHRLDRLIALAVLAQPGATGFESYSQIEAVEYGWWYTARLPGGSALVSLMTDMDIARAQALFGAEGFSRSWQETKEIAQFALPVTSAPFVFAAGTQFIDQAIAPGWLALGDALFALDPLSASGITGAIEDAIAASELLVDLLDDLADSEARDLFRDYANRANAGLHRFVGEHRAIYAMEGRWPDSAFWRRRRAAAYTARPASIPS